jgi:Flp pilus assembly protein TadD
MRADADIGALCVRGPQQEAPTCVVLRSAAVIACGGLRADLSVREGLEELSVRLEQAGSRTRSWPRSPEPADPGVEAGDRALSEGRHDEAVRVFREILVDNPLDARARSQLACALWARGETALAIAEQRTALRIDPQRSATALQLGEWLAATRSPREARSLYREFLETTPGDPDVAKALAALPPEG